MRTRSWATPVQSGLIALGLGVVVLPLAFPLIDWEPNRPAHALAPVGLLGGIAITGFLLGRRVVRWQSRDSQLSCRGCGYDLTGNVSGTCPECGAQVHPASGCTRRTGLKLGCLSLLSVTLGMILMLVWVFSHSYRRHIDGMDFGPWIGVTGDVRVGIQCLHHPFVGPPHAGQLWLTNGEFPYTGSIIAVSDSNGRSYPPTRVISLNFPFYFRHITQPGMIWWTARIPIPFLLTLLAIAPGMWVLKRVARPPKAERV